MMIAKNYGSRVLRDMQFVVNLPIDHVGLKKPLVKLIEGVGNSIVFSMPDNGVIFDDKLKGIKGEVISLPYPSLCIEFDKGGDTKIPCLIYAEQNDSEIAIYSFVDFGNGFLPNQYSQTIMRAWDLHCDDDTMMVSKPESTFDTDYLYDMTSKDSREEKEKDRLQSLRITEAMILPLLELVEALSCENVYSEPLQKIPASINLKRIKKGKTPLLETHVLCIKAPNQKNSKGVTVGTHKSPRVHLRRGHIRRLGSGKKTWVQACVVRGEGNGIINKSYSVSKA